MPPPQITVPHSATSQRTQFLDAYAVLEQAIAQHVFPGAAFGVLVRGSILALDGVGRFTYDSGSPTVSASTVYDLASVTKVLATTSMAMLLYDRGRLPLDAPITRWLPGFSGSPSGSPSGSSGEGRDRVTVRMLLTHSSGLPGYVRLYQTNHDAESLFDACLRLPLEARPGERYAYSDPGFILLGKLLESIAGEPIDQFCAREIFNPLGMSSTRYLPPAGWRQEIPPTEHDLAFRRRLIQGEVQDENCSVLGGVSGHAGLFSNALDPLLYAASLLGKESSGVTAGRAIFSPGAINLFTTRQHIPPESSRALGWDTPSRPSSSGSLFSPHSAGHLGFAGTSLWIDFDGDLAVVLLTNRTWPNREDRGIRRTRPAFHDAVRRALLTG